MKNFCDYSKKCNSCQLCNLSYGEQLRHKENICRKNIGKICKTESITPSPQTTGYRNKAQFIYKKAGKELVSGIYRSSTGGMMVAERCAICSDKANETATALKKLLLSFKVQPFDSRTGKGWLKSIVVREARETGEFMLIINGADRIFPAKRTFSTALKKACPHITTAVITVNADPYKLHIGKVSEVLFGEGYITDVLCGEKFIISPSSFYQINHAQTQQLYKKAIELAELSGNERILDAYCGIGTIGIIAAKKAKEVYAVELNKEAIADARRNARMNGRENIHFVAADSKMYAKMLAENGEKIDVAFIDPPRAGCTASFLSSLSKLSPDKIIYISCNPETQARDLRVLGRLGYTAQICYPFDMFPHTNHTECICMLSRKDK